MSNAAEYLIWSYEHDGWWMPGGWGYTRELTDAGRFTQAEAEHIVAQANLVTINECMVPDTGTATAPPARPPLLTPRTGRPYLTVDDAVTILRTLGIAFADLERFREAALEKASFR